MHTTHCNTDGTHGYKSYAGSNLFEYGSGYPTRALAKAAAEHAERLLLVLRYDVTSEPFQNDYMSDDDIMAELEDV